MDSTLISEMVLAQAVGFVAFALGVTALLSNDDRKLKLIMTVQSFVLSLHFFLLLGPSAAVAVTFISGIRNAVSTSERLKRFAPVFVIFYISIGYYNYKQPLDLLPILAGLSTTIALFHFKAIKMRLCILFATSFWIIHNALVMSIGPFFMEICMLAANLRTIHMMASNKEAITHAQTTTPISRIPK